MKHKNYDTVDLFKYICAILVVVVHVNPFIELGEFYNFIAINVLGRIAVPFFFIANGYFFAKSYKANGTPYFKSYIKNIIKKYIFWSILYLPFGLYWLTQHTDFSFSFYPVALIYAFLNVGTFYHLWYIPALVFALVAIVFLNKRIKLRWLLVLGLLLYVIGASETYVSYLTPQLSQFLYKYIDIFYTTRNGLFYGFVFVLLGFIANQETVLSKFKYNGWAALTSYGLIVVEAFNLYSSSRLDFNFLFMLIPFTYFIFQYALHKDCSIHMKGMRELGSYYYFIHAMVIELVPMFLLCIHQEALFDSGLFRLTSVLICTHILAKVAILYQSKRKQPKLSE